MQITIGSIMPFTCGWDIQDKAECSNVTDPGLGLKAAEASPSNRNAFDAPGRGVIVSFRQGGSEYAGGSFRRSSQIWFGFLKFLTSSGGASARHPSQKCAEYTHRPQPCELYVSHVCSVPVESLVFYDVSGSSLLALRLHVQARVPR